MPEASKTISLNNYQNQLVFCDGFNPLITEREGFRSKKNHYYSFHPRSLTRSLTHSGLRTCIQRAKVQKFFTPSVKPNCKLGKPFQERILVKIKEHSKNVAKRETDFAHSFPL